jgi:DNA-binding FadR family transcriptional regulator
MYECDVAGLAAIRRTDEELERMGEALQLMIASGGRLAEYEEADARFHEALVKASHNRLLLGIYRTVAELILVGFEAGAWTVNVEERIAQHKKLYEAIRIGNQEAARRAAQSIIDAFDTQQTPKAPRTRPARETRRPAAGRATGTDRP